MADKTIKVCAADVIISVKPGESESLWGVEFTCHGKEADISTYKMVAEVSDDDAKAMIEAGRVVKA
jgi:hypothetical protein